MMQVMTAIFRMVGAFLDVLSLCIRGSGKSQWGSLRLPYFEPKGEGLFRESEFVLAGEGIRPAKHMRQRPVDQGLHEELLAEKMVGDDGLEPPTSSV